MNHIREWEGLEWINGCCLFLKTEFVTSRADSVSCLMDPSLFQTSEQQDSNHEPDPFHAN